MLKGRVKDGVVVFESQPIPPEDTPVEVHVEEADAPGAWFDEFAGCASDLPPDASINYKHYLYGQPKR